MDRIDRVAREAFGFETLRPGQREAIESVLEGRDTFVVMSTGSGKSAIYQIVALLTEGATIVVSPLIALQRDQVENLAERASIPFAVGARIAHRQWGEGVVQRYDDEAVVVLFDDVGYKTLALDVPRERALLEEA